MFLEEAGVTPSVRSAFAVFAAQGLVLARVSLAQREIYRLYAENGELTAQLAGALRYRSADASALPVVGDWVAVEHTGREQGIIHHVLPRRTCFSRRAAGEREDQQALAANIDVVLLVTGLDQDFNLRRLERYLILTWESGADPVVVLNKSDLCENLPARLAEARSVARGAPVVPASTRRPDGLISLSALLEPHRTFALLGSSGVGKSTLVNSLMGRPLHLTHEVRAADGRGRHTTTYRELVRLPGGALLIDTPGLRELQLWGGSDSLDRAFDDVADFAAQCRFRNCRHQGEPGCAVAQAIESGDLDADRWKSYRKLENEIRRHENRREDKQKWKQISKAMRQYKQR
jgi:ribosome biogenesis GTPase